jgi:2-oxoglutarate ferredoxin oxidoreductase subunit alpha
VAFISYGSADPAVAEARWRLEERHGLKTSYLRLRALPLTQDITDFVAAHQRVYVVELNTDAQMLQLLRLHVGGDHFNTLRAANWGDGLPLTARWLTNHVVEQEKTK